MGQKEDVDWRFAADKHFALLKATLMIGSLREPGDRE